ncbi:hypothetical protein B5V46_18510 (plasmid) [Rhodovulum sp. MB263]|nr:hypothetical protein B5V46_18510 [Rhodovulum sp. MB263]
MPAVEMIATIRRAHCGQIKPIAQICREQRASWNAVRMVIRSGAVEFGGGCMTQREPMMRIRLARRCAAGVVRPSRYASGGPKAAREAPASDSMPGARSGAGRPDQA